MHDFFYFACLTNLNFPVKQNRLRAVYMEAGRDVKRDLAMHVYIPTDGDTITLLNTWLSV